VVLLKHPECTVRHISRTLQFDLSAHKTESTLYLSHGSSVWQNSKDLAAVYVIEKMEFSLVTFLQKTQMPEADVTVACFKMFMAQGTAKQESRNNFILQNCFVKKHKSMTSLSKHFTSSLTISNTIYFADNNKINSIHVS
jgi:hypothetical protein